MGGYLLRRLLWMIPTFIGILAINFAVMRLQGATLVEQMAQGGGAGGEGVAAERKVGGASRRYENYIDRFRRSGNDLPALINVRGWLGKDDVVAWLRATSPADPAPASTRNRLEKELWLAGRFAVLPLAEVLRDESLSELHGPASQAFVLNAYQTLMPRDAERLEPAALQRIQERNRVLRESIIAFEAAPVGFRTVDAEAARKRAVLLAIADDPEPGWRHGPGAALRALLAETGFCDFLRRLATGDLYSESRKEYVFTVIADRWQVTFWLNLLSIVIAWGVAVPLGIHSARIQNSFEDRATTNALFVLWSLPSFFVGTLLLHYLCTADGSGAAPFPNRGLASDGSLWFSTPRYLIDLAWHAALPLLTLSYASFVSLSRYMRGNLLDQLNADYARSARAKGCDEDSVVYGHCLRNSMITLITLGAGLLSALFGGVLVVELIFSIPGLGWLLLDAAKQQDAPLLMGATVIQVGLLLVGILVADLLYAVVDPRIRSRYA